MNAAQKSRADDLLTIFENSSLEPEYGYAQNLHDGRGITFGRAGFCTGTGDGIQVIKKYVELKPLNNTLAKYLPALQRIEDNGGGGDVTGLDGFATAVHLLANDPLFRQAQDFFHDNLYFNPSQQEAKRLGLSFALAKAQLYDSWIQHGESDPGTKWFPLSANGMAAYTCQQLGGYPLVGVDETLWLQTFLARRRWVLLNTDQVWAESVARVDVYTWLLQLGATQLDKPIQLSWDRCTDRVNGTRPRGPCSIQNDYSYSIGGVEYGDFNIP